jgi:hypothetical protein
MTMMECIETVSSQVVVDGWSRFGAETPKSFRVSKLFFVDEIV